MTVEVTLDFEARILILSWLIITQVSNLTNHS